MKNATDCQACDNLLLPPPALLPILLEADRQIASARLDAPYQLYELLHQTAARFAPTDAFYIALYSPEHQVLFFPYNFDKGVYDPPATFPLGNGPTSQVVRSNTPFILAPQTADTQNAGVNFGDMEDISGSAIHVPIRRASGEVIGVLSAQSYQTGVYTDDTLRGLQCLADRAGVVLQRERDEAAWRYRIQAAQAFESEQQRHLLIMADEFVLMLESLKRHAQTLETQAAPEALAALYAAMNDAQTRANLLPLRPDLAPTPAPAADPDRAEALRRLTKREREVLEHMAAGKSSKAIAEELFISTDTVDFHRKNLFAKLKARNRIEAIKYLL